MLPAGDWLISLGFYCVLQYLDPVTSTWQMSSGSAYHRGMIFVTADGFTQRIANLTGCVVSASVANAGTGYVQATTTITAISTIFNGAVPTLLPIVGGALNISGGTLVANGAGYGIAPIVMIPPPPPAQVNANGVGGIQASAIAVIASGTVSSVSITNPGAGYPTAPVAVIVPSPFDPNLTTGITNATVAFTLASAGLIMGALVTNNGSPLANGSLASVTLSVGGAGSSGSLTANVLQTVVSGTLSSAGTGYSTGGVGFMTYGGAPVQGAITNSPESNYLAWMPRQANIAVTAASVSLAAPSNGLRWGVVPVGADVCGAEPIGGRYAADDCGGPYGRHGEQVRHRRDPAGAVNGPDLQPVPDGSERQRAVQCGQGHPDR